LDVPIFCVDYSLAPENRFPRQLEETYYAYCWALKNHHLLGKTTHRLLYVTLAFVDLLKYKILHYCYTLQPRICYGNYLLSVCNYVTALPLGISTRNAVLSL